MPEFEPVDGGRLAAEPDELPGPSGRRWPLVVGLVTALAAVAVAVVLQRSSASEPAPAPSGSAQPSTASPLPLIDSPFRLVTEPVSLDLPGVVVGVDVAPDGFAAALSACRGPERGCRRGGLAVSEDGRRWRRARLSRGVSQPLVLSMGGGALVLEQPTPRGRKRWWSGDAGQTWRRVPTKPADPAPDASAGALTLTSGHGGTGCAGDRLAVLRRDGRTAPLRRQPAGIEVCQARPYPDPEGRLWVAGRDGTRPAVAVSDDHGASWRTWTLPDDGIRAHTTRLEVARRHVYLTVIGTTRTGSPRDGVTAIYWYDGRKWRRTARFGDSGGEIHAVTACPHGMLLGIHEHAGTRDRPRQAVSFDRGRSWLLVNDRTLIVGSPTTSQPDAKIHGRWLDPKGLSRYVVSTHCRVWHTLPVD